MSKSQDIAKQIITDKLLETFPVSTVADKKIYINVPTEEEVVQIAVSLTCPKNKIALSGEKLFGSNAETAEEIKQNSQYMLNILGL